MGFRDKMTNAVGAQAHDEALVALKGGGRYYTPVLAKASGLAAGIDTWALALEGIELAGMMSADSHASRWRLHTWAVGGDGTARPLFERVVD
jgi:hypothetical protein